jgi:tRNA (cmo5U34)-methyltransferase
MSHAAHLGIDLHEYDARIRTFIPDYEEMLDQAAAAVARLGRRRPRILDLGTGTGALAGRCVKASPGARVVGIDADAGMLRLATRRMGKAFTAIVGDFAGTPFPPCHVVTASFALHHVFDHDVKADIYRRARAALTSGGVLVSADCMPPTTKALRVAGHAAWRDHLAKKYGRARADGYLRAWAKEDHYVPLAEEMRLLGKAGFVVEVIWRRGNFCVVAALAPRKAARG